MSREETRLRPVDLARAAGISTQQVRNYEEAGVLPPVPRTASGYRVYGVRHREALLTYRALAAGHGPDAARGIMRAVHADDVPGALALVNAGHAALHEQRLSLQAASEALTALAEQGADTGPPVPRAGLRIGEVAARLGVRTSALRVWESAGLLTLRREPVTGYRVFGPDEIREARIVQLLRQSRYLFAHIRPVLGELRDSGGTEALGAVLAERRAALTHRTTTMLRASGLLHAYVTRPVPPASEPGR
ncbi:MerR family transcriptional regulator [Streptomyces iconiensis]|uniref:MerR family DNA-binding transcriptional regulator n=1 Tax=Streptomyces iconiensis TaxID=1384038 RepID=A0ABT6ZPJ3_9ACTN|nr:MerR family transcriptional regulator [Streptomyces iconiensis]MDJ1130966.1 MerR family DNA-binding transcriptional regulator [Streptomyces iconiensis]